MKQRLLRYGIPLVIVALFVVGLSGIHQVKAPKKTGLTLEGMQAQLRGSPPQLATLHSQGAKLLPTTKKDFKAKIAAFKGTPVVVNKWASWCGPCRFEFPYLQRTATQFGRKIAFLGLNSADSSGDARAFLRRFPVPYPSFTDPLNHVGYSLDMPSGAPVTEFYNAAGKRTYTHAGVYATRALLVDDIRRYALQQ